MSRHWQPRRSSWLSPEAYDALSAAEKRALWRDRKMQRREARYRPKPARYRKGYYARRRLAWVAAVMVIGSAFSLSEIPLSVPLPSEDVVGTPGQGEAPLDTLGTNGVRASFSACHSGGGTNCVVDGDTIYLAGQKIRIAGIDAPETHEYRCASELALGQQAAARLRELVNSGAVSLTSIDRDEDRYGRKLRNVAVDGRDVGETLVSEGLAREYGSGRRGWCG